MTDAKGKTICKRPNTTVEDSIHTQEKAAPTQTHQGSTSVMIQETATQDGIPLMIQGIPTQTNQQHLLCIPGNQKPFPIRPLKIFGGIQIVLGILLGLLSIIGIALDAGAMNADCDQHSNSQTDNYGYKNNYWRCWKKSEYSQLLFAFDITCLVGSGWYIMTGVLPIFMNKKRKNSWRGIRVAFMVCSIIGASVFGPTMFSLGVVGSLMRAETDTTTVLSAFMAVLSFSQFVIAIVTSSFCCCFTPWINQQQTGQLVFMSATQPGMFVNIPQTQIPVMNYQPTTMAAAGGQDLRAQQYALTTNQQQCQQKMSNQLGPTFGAPSPSNEPPAYKD